VGLEGKKMELYSKRTQATENPARAYRHDLPMEFRNQVIFIWSKAAGYSDHSFSRGPIAPYDLQKMALLMTNQLFDKVRTDFCEEYGLAGLPESGLFDTPCQSIRKFFQSCADDQALDIIQLTFNEILAAEKNHEFMGYVQPLLGAAESVARLNGRFQEHSIGFRLEQGRIIRIDSDFLHAEAVEPGLQLMYTQGCEGAFQEFMLAQRHYRQGPDHYDDCLTNCGKSLESTLKTICDRRKWVYKASDTASQLLELVFSKELIPTYLQSHFSALRTTFESGVPTIRNREGGHGSGEKPNEVPEHLAAYQLHLTASAIVFLIRANEDFNKRKP
jgi:hypothetical protein